MRTVRIAFTAAALCAACAAARPPPSVLMPALPTRPLVTAVEFVGDRSVPERRLRAAIRTESPGPFGRPRPFDPDLAEEDAKRIERFYRARILSLAVDGLDALPRPVRQDVRRDLPLRRGEPLDEERYDASKALLLQRLRARGYAFAEVDGRAVVAADGRSAEVRFEATPGAPFRFGPIDVEGHRTTTGRPVRLAARLTPGGPFDADALDRAQASVYDLGIYRAVAVEPGPPLPGNRLPIRIEVRERPLESYEVGVGLGADGTRQKARLRATYRHANLFGGLDRLEATLIGGYAVLPSIFALARGGPLWGAEARFRRPHLFRRRLTLAASLNLERAIEPSFTEDAARATVGIDREVRRLRVGAGYGLIVYRLTGVVAADEPTGTPTRRLDRCPTPCTLSYVEPRVTWDRRDDPVEPRHGWLAALQVESGGGPLGGTHDYLRLAPEVRGYVGLPVGAHEKTIALRAKAGWLRPRTGTSPVVRRFFGGGPDGHRGYALNRFAPMVRRRGGGTTPIGADRLLELSAEYRQELGAGFLGTAFVDAGAAGDGIAALRPSGWSWAVGPGIRRRTRIGTVRLDVGWLVSGPARRTVDPPHFPVRDPRWVVHVGLGESF